MMKIILMVLFMIIMMIKNIYMMFYYNLFYLMSFMLLSMYGYNESFLWSGISLHFGMNYYSFWLIMLSFWIIGLVGMHLEKNSGKMIVFFVLLVALIMFFMSLDLLYFYLIFEVSLIPIFFLIIYWGHNPERLSASYYLMIYMLLISFPLLLYIFKMFLFSYSLKFSLLEIYMEKYGFYFMEMVIIYGAFLIKMPMYMAHIWLPKAHVEASVEGSMILAGILLKMGGYGLIRLMLVLLKFTLKFNYLFMAVGLVGSLLMSILCINQVDMKMLVAYSSVVHMNMMMVSMLTFYKLGILSSLIIMISHGLCSSGLFYMVNLYYKISGSRLLILNKGIVGGMTFMTMWWFLLCSANFSFPFSLNFIGEILMLSVILNWDMAFMIYLVIICFFSGVYSLHLYIYVQHGGNEWINKNMKNLIKEFMVLIMHFFPLILLLLNLIMYM